MRSNIRTFALRNGRLGRTPSGIAGFERPKGSGNEGKLKVTKNELTGEKMVQENFTLENFISRVKSIIEQQKIE